MCVTEAIDFDAYWNDPQFAAKRPQLSSSKKRAFGDNIYHRNAAGEWLQEDSHHSYADGTMNPYNIERDTKAPRALLSTDYKYYGGSGPKIPARFRNFHGADICAGRGYKRVFPEILVERVITWIRGLPDDGYAAEPLDWST